MQKQPYAGIDLHSNNRVVATVDQSGKRLGHGGQTFEHVGQVGFRLPGRFASRAD